jgi:hypothetical protein
VAGPQGPVPVQGGLFAMETADKKQDRSRFTTLPVMEETGFV